MKKSIWKTLFGRYRVVYYPNLQGNPYKFHVQRKSFWVVVWGWDTVGQYYSLEEAEGWIKATEDYYRKEKREGKVVVKGYL